MENKKLIDANPIVQFIMDGLNNPDKMKALGYDAIEILAEIEYAPTVDAVEVVYCDNCVAHGSCVFESALHCLGYKKPFCCAGKMDGDEDD